MSVTLEPAKIIVKAAPASADRCALGDACPTRLTCELARQCLPQDKPDPNIKFAWANAICVLFILIGLYGLRSPLFILSAAAKPVAEIVPVVFMPPPPSMQAQATPAPSDSAPSPDSVTEPMDIPEVAPAVAPANANVSFAVPVEGPVRVVPVKYAAAPPVQRRVVAPPPVAGPPGNGSGGEGDTTKFDPANSIGGTYPKPIYPQLAARLGLTGIVTLLVRVDSSGMPMMVTVSNSSGSKLLDQHTADWVKRKWRWPTGQHTPYLVDFKYQK